MALVKILQPPTVVLSGNPVVFAFEATGRFEVPGSCGVFYLSLQSFPSVGSSFILNYNGSDHLFTFVTTPGSDPGELPASYTGMGGAATFSMYLMQVLSELQKHFYLSKDFEITLTGLPVNPLFCFSAKLPGSSYKITLGANPTAPVTTDPLLNTPGIDPGLRPFYSGYIQIYANGQQIGEDLAAPDEDSVIRVNLSAYLQAHAISSFTWPPAGFVTVRTDLLLRYHIRYAERWGIPAGIKKLQSTAGITTLALPGGVGFMQQAMFSQMQNHWFSTLQYTKQFLTWAPRHRHIKTHQIEKLFFFFTQPAANLQLRARITWFDTQSQMAPLTVVVASVPVSQYQILELSFSFDQLGFAQLQPQRRVQKFELYLSDTSGTAISEKRHYYLDYRSEPHTHAFIWRNSFGMYDTELFFGSYQESVTLEKKIFSVVNRFVFNILAPQTQVLESTLVEKVEASSGWFEDPEKAHWLKELLLSKEVYEVVDGVLHPVVITSGDVFVGTRGISLHNIAFSYTRAFTDEHFSKGSFVTATFLESFNNAFNTE